MRPPFMDDRTKSKFITLATLNGEEICKPVSDEESVIDEDDDTNDKISTVADIFTKEIAQTLVSEFEVLTSRKPHLILANIHRSKVDPNRPIENAALGNKLAEAVYKDYHKFIVEAKTRVEGPGLLIDLHGQNHHQNSIEIGYLYTKTMLNQGNYSSLSAGPSVRALLARHQLTPAHRLEESDPPLRASQDLGPEQISCGEVSVVILLGQQLTLSPFPCTWSTSQIEHCSILHSCVLNSSNS